MNHLFKSFTSVLLGAAALASLATGCVREQFSTNPNYNPDSNTVKTKFTLNINTAARQETKMTAANTQANGNNFLGMQDVHILTYTMDAYNTPSGWSTTGWTIPATDDPTPVIGKFFFNPDKAGRATEDYNFGRLFEAGSIVTSGDNEKQSRSLELSFPLQTNVVVLYGKALNTKGPEYQGSITASGDPANLATLRFTLTPRIDKTDKKAYQSFTAGTYGLQSILSSMTIAGLIKEDEYWTTDGKKKTAANEGEGSNQYQVTGLADKRYKVWLPFEPSDPAYEELSFTKPGSTTEYVDGEEYQPTTGETPQHTYTLKVGNCSWKMLGDMYAAKYDGDDTTTEEAVSNACGGNGLTLSPLLGTLGEAYHKLITISTITEGEGASAITYHELRAGSAAAILRTMRDLDFILHKAIAADPTTWEELVAQNLAKEIHDRMKLFFDGHLEDMYYRDAKDIKTELGKYVDTSEGSDWDKSGFADNFSNKYLKGTGTGANAPLDGQAGFPMNIGLPMGAAYIETDTGYYWKADRFQFKEEIPAYAFGSTEYFNIFDYCYPAELMYYGNSPLRISNTAHTDSQYPATLTDWNDDSKWAPLSDWTKFGAVTSDTRSVAMVDQINYGTALLKSTVVYGSGFTSLLDNNHGIHPTESAKEIPVIGTPGSPVTSGLYVTGIVVGGQPAAVTWDFTRMPDYVSNDNNTPGDTTDDTLDPPSYAGVTYSGGKFNGLSFFQDQFKKMIYDKVDVEDQFRIGDPEADNSIYTLCWDNYAADKVAADQADVYVALELRNGTGEDFWGETNLIRNGGTFYLVGKLDMKSKIESNSADYANIFQSRVPGGTHKHGTEDVKNGAYYYPPFNPANGETVLVPRVLMQDYMTTATLTLKQDCLKHAYMTVPDLRTNQVSLGVSVDIQWETGLNFDVEMGKL